MNSITHIYGNGCSFMKDHLIRDSDEKLYVQLIAEHYNLNWTNSAEPGVCNRRIIRTAARDSLKLGPETFVLISLTHWARTEKYSSTKNFGIDEFHVSIKHNSSNLDDKSYYDFWLKNTDLKAELSNLSADIVMLSGMLNSRGIKHLIYCHSATSKENLSLFKNSEFGQEIVRNQQILNIFETSLCQHLGPGNWFYDITDGHLSPLGHRHAADVLVSLIDAQV